jgi:hypothetical protein
MPSGSVIITLLIVVEVTALAACGSPTLPRGAEPFTPPAVYARWWRMTEQCSGRTGDLGRIRWFRTPGSEMVHKGSTVTGYWSMRDNMVVIAEDHIRHGLAVRHEMLHALLGTVGHARSAFLESCAAVVDCSGLCAQEAVPWSPPSQFMSMPPESLVATGEPVLLAREPDGDRFVQLRVRVENARSTAVFVVVPGFTETPPTFGYDLRGPAGGISSNVRADDSSLLFFGPGATKEKVFEFLERPTLTQLSVPQGEYLIRGGYGSQWAPFRALAVVP